MNSRLVLAAALSLAVATGCSRDGADAEGRVLGREGARAPAAPRFDPEKPAAALAIDADEAAHRLGSFEWTAGAEWTVSRQGSAESVRAVERHHVVQAATGEFLAETGIDPGLGEGSETGRDVIWAGNMTYARGKWAPWRERPGDHGRDARRYRGESFGLAGDLARLFGPRLALGNACETSLLGRAAIRYALSLAADVAEAAPAADARVFPQGGPDPDTKARLALLDGAQPVSARGELIVDAQTGVPLRVSLDAAYGVKADPRARIQVSLRAEVKALGAGVPSVTAPANALPDERKPRGVADALERAGLKKKDGDDKKKDEPGDDGEP
ncbi:MAG TPA: hypothetical protein VLT61_13615 [Anaeromyxobacteraceae bacterium]|nr:hypothetical protein [Anaeromyxobacteraceae bacterium]